MDDFEKVVAKCFGHKAPAHCGSLWNTRSLEPPQFSLERINYIMIFAGCFNPPHIGHLNFLRHSFLAARRDLNVVAAVFEVRNNAVVKRKCAGKGLVLDTYSRVRMMAHDKRLASWAWVAYSCLWDLETFQREADEMNVRVKFLRLRSAELALELRGRALGLGKPFDGIIVNTYGRRGESSLDNWAIGDKRWTRLSTDEEHVQRYRMMLRDKEVKTWGFVWVFTRGEFERKSAVSSTRIREAAGSMTTELIEEQGILPQLILGWELLKTDRDWIEWHTSAQNARSVDTTDVCKALEDELLAELSPELYDPISGI